MSEHAVGNAQKHYLFLFNVTAVTDARSQPALPESYSVKTTDCTPEISNRFRQRIFLQAIKSSLRSM